ncbi:MAG: alpha/beta fold hydrolase, partial [Chloroflexi bacterium]|nr:alpha/beta fold hydrolase [Chloroflexota bacterium]
MANFVLVHGNFHGGWAWKRVAPLLRGAGHDVFAVTLTGLGERSHLVGAEINLQTHIQDVVNVLKYEELTRAVLVGHSSGGMVITGVANAVPDLVAHLVYLDAAVPSPGQSLLDLLPPERSKELLERARAFGDGSLLPPPSGDRLWGITQQADMTWVKSKLTPHPVAAMQQPLPITENRAERIPSTFISCTVDQIPMAAAIAARVRKNKAWRYRELATGHAPNVTMPKELAALLL